MPFPEPFGGPFGSGGLPPPLPPPVINVVNTWQLSAGSSYTYGTTQLPVANTTGNWLFAIAQWETTQDLAVAWAADDAHNFWQPVICTTSATSPVRTAILVVPNARAATTVSFSTSAFVRNAVYTVIEVQGLQAAYVLDMTALNSSTGATALTISGTAASVDFLLASAVQHTTSSSITVSGGWTAIAAANNTTLQSQIAWRGAAPGAQSLTFTNSGAASAPWAGVMIGVVEAAALPQNANRNWPVISCQAAFGASPGDTSAYPVWTDITSRFLGLDDAQRGKQFELDQLEAADVTFTFDNADGALSPFNSASPYWPNVTLLTRVRLLSTWQGRTDQIFNGHIEYIPQTYDFQRGIVKARCTDDFAKLPQVMLQSCMQNEVLYDKPYAYWPLNDAQGSPFASNNSGRSSDTFDIANVYGGASSSFGVSQTFFAGHQGTVWSTSTSGPPDGPSRTALRDYTATLPAISASGVTIECWANLTQIGSLPIVLMALEGNCPSAGGAIAYIQVNPAPGGLPSLVWNDASGTPHSVNLSSSLVFDGKWHHYAVELTSTTYNAFFDGAPVASGNWTLINTFPHIFEIGALTGPLSTSYAIEASQSPLLFAHAAYYDRVIDAERIAAHYASGVKGFRQELTGARIQRLLTYIRWGRPQAVDPGQNQMQQLDYLAVGGYGSMSIRGASGLFGTFGTGSQSGTQADLAIVDAAASENGTIYIDSNGTFVFRQRSNLYNQKIVAVYGDNFVPLNANPYFRSGISSWTGNNGAAPSPGNAVWTYSGVGSLMFSGDGSTANPNVTSEHTIPVTAGSNYTFDTWLYSPQGWGTVQILINWYTSSGTYLSTSSGTSFNLNPATPTRESLTAAAPAPAAGAAIIAQMTGTPAASVQLVTDRATLSATGFQAGYNDDIQIDYDVTYLYNDVTITRNSDQAAVRLADTASQAAYLPRTYSRTIFTYADNPPQEVIDCASWLLTAYKQPVGRIARMVVNAEANADVIPTLTGTDIGDLVTVVRTPVGAPPIAANYVVLAVEPVFRPDEIRYTYALAPVLVPVLTLDNPVFGTLGNNYLGW